MEKKIGIEMEPIIDLMWEVEEIEKLSQNNELAAPSQIMWRCGGTCNSLCDIMWSCF